jgi:hypothetical protein
MNMDVDSADNGLPLIELLKTQIVDRKTGERTTGMVGNNFRPTCATTISACCSGAQ